MFKVRSLMLCSSLALGLFAGCAGEEEDFALADDESALQATDDVTSEADELGPDTVDMTGIGGPVAAAQAINSFVEFANGTVFGEATIHNPDSNVLSMCVKIVRDGRVDDGRPFHCTGSRLGSGSTKMAAPQLRCGGTDNRNHKYKTRIELHLKNNGIAFGESRAITLRRVCR